ncbi:MAG TPA: hypothetical protein PLC91_00310 [Candidatus Cloacimonadota bacterium]|nr:hypothetical protein [Candidatus Cloacimonadota bacterium]HQH49924.1 hypothetical protein [Candidatus Cloacimonadota bacterium]
MNVSDLIGIGRLGGQDADGFFQVLIKARYREVFSATNDVYLIFNSDRVFFVTICERNVSDRKMRVRFAEDGVAEERKLHREVIIAIPPEDQEEDDAPADVFGFSVVFQDKEIGVVEDYFHNNAQYVLVIKCGAQELLIPWVDYYVSDIIPDPGVIVLSNAESFLEELTDNDAD